MTATITLHPGCKVNIYLDILGLRKDGYHDLRTLFFPLPHPHDTLTIAAGTPGCGLGLTCTGAAIKDQQNILNRTYKAFAEHTGFTPDLNVHLYKNIPMGAGLGGGSSDAASFLTYLNEASGSHLVDARTLQQIALKLGADVPFFLLNRPAWGEGRGNRLTPVDISLTGLRLLLVCPDIHVSTAWAYEQWDHQRRPHGQALLTDQALRDMFFSWPNFVFHNSFEKVVFAAYPELRSIKEQLLSRGANGVVLSGSGASIFSVFRDPCAADAALQTMTQMHIPTYISSFPSDI